MPISADYLQESLLRHSYFPYKRKSKEELPPVFTSRQLVPSVASKLVAKKHRTDGYDQVDYLLTRHSNLPRVLSIPHPLPYCHLVQVLTDNISKLEYSFDNVISRIKPSVNGDNRLIQMDYDDGGFGNSIYLEYSFGKKFRVYTDITNCYPSIYTHAIPWALVGVKESKDNKTNKAKWYNNIDYCQRMMKRGETYGIAIGPASSNLVSELILARIDELLGKKYSYYRHIDDYTCYCSTYEEGQRFLKDLRQQLKAYGLALNIKKTEVVELPFPHEPEWLIDLSTRSPLGSLNEHGVRFFSSRETIRFLEYALVLNNRQVDDRIIKHAVKTVINQLDESATVSVFHYLLDLVRHYPSLLPVMQDLFDGIDNPVRYARYLNEIGIENATEGRSDGLSWALYYLAKYHMVVSFDLAEATIDTNDCVGLVMLYLTGAFNESVISYVEAIDKTDRFHLDRYWLLLYQLYFDGLIADPYGDGVFELLKHDDVSFVEREGHESVEERKFKTEQVAKMFAEVL